MPRSNAALYVSLPNGKPYSQIAFDSDTEAFEYLYHIQHQTNTRAVACRMQQHDLPYSEYDEIVPVWEFDLVLCGTAQPDRTVLHAAIRMQPVVPTVVGTE